MKLTAEKLKQLIKEEMENLSEMMSDDDKAMMGLQNALEDAAEKAKDGEINSKISELLELVRKYNSGEK